jgi:hypothetical protein
MIGPPGLPKYPRRVFAFAGAQAAARTRAQLWKLALGLYLAGAVAHFSHNLALDLAAGRQPSLGQALVSDAVSLVWPADLIGVLIGVGLS